MGWAGLVRFGFPVSCNPSYFGRQHFFLKCVFSHAGPQPPCPAVFKNMDTRCGAASWCNFQVTVVSRTVRTDTEPFWLKPFWLKSSLCLVDFSSSCIATIWDASERMEFGGGHFPGRVAADSHGTPSTICEVADQMEAQCVSRFFTSRTNHDAFSEDTSGRQSCFIGSGSLGFGTSHGTYIVAESPGRHHESEGGQAVQISRRGLGCREGQSGLSGSINPSVGRCRPCDTQSSPGCIGEGPYCSQWCSSRCQTRFVCQVRQEEETIVGEVRRGHGKTPHTSCICGRRVEGWGGPFGILSCRSSCANAPTTSAQSKRGRCVPHAASHRRVATGVEPITWTRSSKKWRMPLTRKGLASSLPEHLLPSAEELHQHPGEV